MKVNLTVEVTDAQRAVIAASEGKRGAATRDDVRDLVRILLDTYCAEFADAPRTVLAAGSAPRQRAPQ